MSAPATSPDRRQKIHYPIPSSDLALEITLQPNEPLPQSLIDITLASAIEQATTQAKEHGSSTLVQRVWEVFLPQPEPAQTTDDDDAPRARFGIVGGMYCNRLTWTDVEATVGGLTAFYGEREARGEVPEGCIYYVVEDGGRRNVGQGSLRPVNWMDDRSQAVEVGDESQTEESGDDA